MQDPLAAGLYEQLMTRSIRGRLGALRAVVAEVPADEQADLLGRFVGAELTRHLQALPDGQRVAATNALLSRLGDLGGDLAGDLPGDLRGGFGNDLDATAVDGSSAADRVRDLVEDGPHRLLALLRPVAPGVVAVDPVRPLTALAAPALITNGTGDPQLGHELRAELPSADRVDLLCAFVKWYGLRVLQDQLEHLASAGVPIRVITTTYLGATERRALDRLVREFGADVKVNYETRSTRLHAKAWLIHRDSGFSSAYIGSSNLSRAALLDGLEWNVKLAGAHTPQLLAKFSAAFESYWSDEAFLTYDPDRDGNRLDDALRRARGSSADAPLAISGLEVRPYPHQQGMLEDLALARDRGHHRNLVVAATGTGKTVVAALDYAAMPGRPSLLFVAHRKELLQQALRTYREVLADGSFGELWVDGARPSVGRHVFASIQSLLAAGVATLPPGRYAVVVVDEFHHAEAASYRTLLGHLEPVELLGLTATPERADGLDVRSFFGGRTASELRLWDALDADLLCPMHYFGVADGTDLSRLGWTRGDYDRGELENLLTANDARVRIVLRQLQDKVDVSSMRALGFCVSVAHAQFMAERFRAAGIPAEAVSAQTPADQRAAALAGLRAGAVRAVFAVDLFNEGVDIPDVDTLLLLRPTQSATVFLQQLGRGLRRTAGKPVLTVLDFIGQQGTRFRFDLKLRALTGLSRRGLTDALVEGFAHLPSGSEIIFDQVAQRTVLDNVRQQLALRHPELVAEVRRTGERTLPAFLRESGRELSDVYATKERSWTRLRRDAGLGAGVAPGDETLLRRMGAFLHVDDAERVRSYQRLLTDATPYEQLPDRLQRYARMLFLSVWTDRSRPDTYEAGLSALRADGAFTAELHELLDVTLAAGELRPLPLTASLQHLPLAVHARYSREEALAAIDYADLTRAPRSMQTGVVWAERTRVDALFVTLDKDEAHHSASTMYRDYALSPRLFHWESQNSTTAGGPVGSRYIAHESRGSHVLLFVRRTRTADWTAPSAYVLAGSARYVRHQGEKPMAITWALSDPLPPELHREASLVG